MRNRCYTSLLRFSDCATCDSCDEPGSKNTPSGKRLHVASSACYALRPKPPPARTMPDKLTVTDLAKRWNVSKRHVYTMIERGELPAVQYGRAVRIELSAVEEYEQQEAPYRVAR